MEHEANNIDYDALFILEERAEIEHYSAMSAFLHWVGSVEQDTHPKSVYVGASKTTYNLFDGIRIDTIANRTLVIGIEQFRVYFTTFNLSCSPKLWNDRVVKGIDGGWCSIGTVVVQVPIKILDLILDVQLAVIKVNIPTFLLKNDLSDSTLDILVQRKFASLQKRRHPLVL